MRFLWGREPGSRGGIVSLGTFDGVHQGHIALLRASQAWARELHTYVEIWVYHPHPRTILRQEEVPLITTLEERSFLLEEYGVEVLRVIQFSRDLSLVPAEAFVQEWLVRSADPRGVVLGYDLSLIHISEPTRP
ncbi:MAG: hypothetical protein N2170_08110, partial [Bacteroidia bacterium]|nr:hypothetical protein [Bacteroidia bacterium]